MRGIWNGTFAISCKMHTQWLRGMIIIQSSNFKSSWISEFIFTCGTHPQPLSLLCIMYQHQVILYGVTTCVISCLICTEVTTILQLAFLMSYVCYHNIVNCIFYICRYDWHTLRHLQQSVILTVYCWWILRLGYDAFPIICLIYMILFH